MEIVTRLRLLKDAYAVCEALVEHDEQRVTVHGVGLAAESGRYVELAQVRALLLAQQILEQGIASLSESAFLDRANVVGAVPTRVLGPVTKPIPHGKEAAVAGQTLPDAGEDLADADASDREMSEWPGWVVDNTGEPDDAALEPPALPDLPAFVLASADQPVADESTVASTTSAPPAAPITESLPSSTVPVLPPAPADDSGAGADEVISIPW